MLLGSGDLRVKLAQNAARFRAGLSEMGYTLVPGQHPIIPVMLGEAGKATALAAELGRRGVYVTAFSYPVVPHGKARIRTQMNAALTDEDISFALEAFAKAGRALGLI